MEIVVDESIRLIPKQPDDRSQELKHRIREMILYAKLPVVEYTWQQGAYEDMTSMGTPYLEPARTITSRRSMNPDELTAAICQVISSFDSFTGNIRDRTHSSKALTQIRCQKGYLNTTSDGRCVRCLKCNGCLRYIRIIDQMRGLGPSRDNTTESQSDEHRLRIRD